MQTYAAVSTSSSTCTFIRSSQSIRCSATGTYVAVLVDGALVRLQVVVNLGGSRNLVTCGLSCVLRKKMTEDERRVRHQ
jgi:hypothetical protein